MTMDVQAMVLEKLALHSSLKLDYTHMELSTKLDDLQLDSLAVLELVYELEEHFDTSIDVSDLHSHLTITDLIDIVNASLGAAVS